MGGKRSGAGLTCFYLEVGGVPSLGRGRLPLSDLRRSHASVRSAVGSFPILVVVRYLEVELYTYARVRSGFSSVLAQLFEL